MTAQNTPAEPMFYVRLCSDNTYEGPIHASAIERVRVESGAWSPLYLAASPQPAAQQPVAVPLQQALTLSANRLERLALELPYGSTARSDATDWANEARTAAAAPQAPSREPLTELAEKVLSRMIEGYRLRPWGVATSCDTHIDRSGNLLGWLREANRITKEGGKA